MDRQLPDWCEVCGVEAPLGWRPVIHGTHEIALCSRCWDEDDVLDKRLGRWPIRGQAEG
jgi:hypothetical protein